MASFELDEGTRPPELASASAFASAFVAAAASVVAVASVVDAVPVVADMLWLEQHYGTEERMPECPRRLCLTWPVVVDRDVRPSSRVGQHTPCLKQTDGQGR